MQKITLAEDRRAALISQIQARFQSEFDDAISDFRAGQILDLMIETLGPGIYNQAVQDVRGHLQSKLDDLAVEIYIDET